MRRIKSRLASMLAAVTRKTAAFTRATGPRRPRWRHCGQA